MNFFKFATAGIMAVCLFLTGFAFAADKPIDVLMVGHSIPRDFEPCWPKFQAACAKDGVRIYILNEDTRRGQGYDLYTADLLRKFNVIVFSGLLENVDKTPARDAEVNAFKERLNAYYKSGGSIIWVPMSFQHWGTLWNKSVGDKYDVQSLEEDIYDPPKVVDVNPAYNNKLYRFIWTTNVSKHQVTEGVKGLLMPCFGEWSWPGTVPMKFGKSWVPVVSGMDSTVTIGNAAPAGSGRADFKPEVKGSYSSAPEIAGVRDCVGSSGRMMVFPFHSTYTYLNFGSFFFNDAMMLNGDGAHPSNGLRLFLNGCKWLAEANVKTGFGGYVPPKRNETPALKPLDWSKAGFQGSSWGGMRSYWDPAKQLDVTMSDLICPDAKDFKGMAGIRTVASDGTGTVPDYVTAAKILGLSFIIFLEDLEKTDDARFAKLVADCKAESGEDFLAIPGFIYRDTGGNLNYAYNVDRLPLPENMTPDRKVKIPAKIVDQFGWTNGQGLAELGKLKVDLAFLYLFTAVSPYVYEGGKLVDAGLAKYCYSEGLGHQYAPLSLTIVKSPAELATTANIAHITVIHAEKLKLLYEYLGRNAQHPHPVYITNGPLITRWGALNPLGHPQWPGKQRVRFTLEVSSDAGISEVKILEASENRILRLFRPNGAKTFSCSIDDTHKQQWVLIPIVTDIKGRTAIGSSIATYQDGNRIWMMGDRLMGMNHVMGWDEKRQKLMHMAGWLGGVQWSKPYNISAGAYPSNPRELELKIQGIDGGALHPSAIDIFPSVTSDSGSEPKVPAFRFKPSLASFDCSVMDYIGDAQFLVNKRNEASASGGWWETPDPQVPNEIADISGRTTAVRARNLSEVAAGIHDVTVTFKRDAKLKRFQIAGMRSGGEKVNPMLMIKDSAGEYAWLINPGENFNRHGSLETGGYLFPSNYRGGAVGVINLGPQPIDYDCSGMSSQIYVSGEGRQVKAGEQIKARFITFMRPWQDQTNSLWLKKFIADYGIGCKPGYSYEVKQGKLRGINYVIDLEAASGGAILEVKKYDLPHNLLVSVSGVPANAIAGRYNLDRKQLLILPVFEETAMTSINTTLCNTRLYTGELFHCDNRDLLMSCVQDGADKLLLELHNPSDKAMKSKLTGVPGFAPLSGLDKTIEVPPFSSVKLELPVTSGSLIDKPYEGD